MATLQEEKLQELVVKVSSLVFVYYIFTVSIQMNTSPI